MRLILGFLIACALLLGLFVWRAMPAIQAARTSTASAASDHSAADRSAPAQTPDRAMDAAPAASDAVVARSDAPVDAASDTLAEIDVLAKSSPSTSPVHWAGQSQIEHARSRLIAARQALALDPDNLAALQDAWKVSAELRLWHSASRFLGDLVRRVPDRTDLRFELATTLMRLSRWVPAAAELKEVVRQDPMHARAWYNLAIAHQALGRLHDARAAWDRTVELSPEDVEVLAHRGEVLLDLADWPSAIADFQRVLAGMPDDVPALLNLALAYEKAERPADAIALLSQAAERSPQNVPVLARWAALRWKAHRLNPQDRNYAAQETRSLCERALQLDPGNATVRELLGQIEREPAGPGSGN